MKRFKENVIRGIVKMGKKDSRLIMPAIVLAAVFLVCYHAVRNFCLQFRYHPVRQRLLVGILIVSLLAGRIGLINLFAATDSTQATENMVISGFENLPEEVREQTVSVGTGLDGLTLPEGYALMEGVSLPEITVTVQENEEETEDTEVLALLDRIAALPDLEEYLAAEPDMDEDEDAYEEWLETLYAYAEEVPAIWEEYEALTEDRKAQIPETEMAKLTAWAEFAETLADSMAVMTVATTVYSGTCGSGVTWTLDSDGTLTISGSGEMTNYTTYSAVSWYNYAGDIKMVTIENGVTSIGSYAFYGCGELKSIEIPSGVTSIGDAAFQGCSSLESIAIPESVTSIGTWAFNNCSSLESIEIPSGVTSIGMYVFQKCSSLESIEIPSGVTSIGVAAFHGCSALESIEIPSGVTSIGSQAFRGCSALESIEIPSGVTSIGMYTFFDCSSLTRVEIPESVTSIGDSAFYNCSSLESIEIPSGVTSIGAQAFYKCSSLESIEIPSGVTSIGTYAFYNCSSLESIEIPSGVTSIGNSAFNGCSALALVIMERTSPATLGTNVFKGCKFVTDSRKDLVVPAGTRDDYIGAANWSSWANYIHEDHDSITWTAWTDSTSLPGAAGNYYLATDVTIGAAWTVPSGTTNLCLNGHTVTFNSGYIEIGSGNALYICDCDEQKKGSLSISNSGEYAVDNAGILGLSGSPTLTGSKADINLMSGAYITVTDTLTGVFSIATADKPTVDAPVTFTNSTTTAYNSTDNFTSADVSYKIQKNSSGQLELAIPAYTVTLHENGGSGGTTLISYVYGIGATLPTDWTKTGYNFAGWYDNADCTGTAVTEISTTDTGDKKYWAKWVDDIAPVIRDLSYSYKPKNLWHWLIGKDSLMITVPVTEEGSGADEITYTITPEGGTAEQKTAVIKNGTATITLSADFQGTIAITCTDKNGNTSASVTAGAALDSDGKGFIIEDNAPEITFAANNGENISSEYYDAAPDITVTVTDDADNAISAGIASITYQIGNGEEITVNRDFATQMVTECEFDIAAGDIPTGETKITVTATDNAGNEASETITVKVKGPESKPAAAINYQTEMLTGLEPNAEYTINGIACRTDADGCIAIDENWLETTIELVRKGNGTETTDSEAQEISLSARPDAPSIMPELDSLTDSSITLKAIDGAQYRLKDGSWQDSTEFTGLAAGTEYTFTVRYEATATAFASEESAPASFYTMPSAPAEGAAQIDYVQETLMLADGIEAFADEACTVPIASGSISDYIGQTIYIRYAADGEIPESGVTAVTIPERPSAPAAGTQNATYPGAQDGKITGLSENTAYEIRKKNDDGTWGEWTNAVLNETEIPNLAAGEYEVHIKAVEGKSFQSEEAAVTIGETPATREEKPDIQIDYRQETLTGFTAGGEYKITVNDKTITVTADTDGTLKLEEEWLGTTVSIVKSGNGKDKLDSEALSLIIPARTAQTPSPGAEDESRPGAGDGKLTGLEAGTAYQISTDNGATWTDVTSDENGEITNLAPGSYIVRIGSTDTDFASKPSAPVTIATCLVTYTVTLHGNGGSGTSLTSYTYGEGAVLPEDWIKADYTFGGWYDNEDCTGTAVTAISATDAGDKEYWAKWNKKSSDSSDNGSDDSTDNSDNASDSDDKEQPETPTVPDNQPDDKKEPTDERRDDTDSTRQEDEETPKQTEPSGETDTTNRIPEGDTVQTVPVEINGGKLVLTGKPVETGNLTDTSKTTTVLMLGDGAVIVTVVCEDDHYTAGVKDTVAVANIVLTPEQLQLVYDGEVIEIRIDVTDISRAVGEQDKEVIEQGLEAWRQEIPELTLGMYVDISMFIRIGESDWDAITFTEEPIDIVIGIPEELQENGREFYIIRSHEGEYTLLSDMDSEQDTITISTDSFSAYAIAYQQVDSAVEEVTAEETEESAKCGLCHICPTFLGICCFIWLALVIVVTVVIVIIIMQKRKDQKEKVE